MAIRAREAARTSGTFVAVFVTTALGLKGFAMLPEVIVGERFGLLRADTVAHAAQRIGAPVLLPAYFPATIAWPPAEIGVQLRRGRAVSVTFVDRLTREPRLVIVQALGEDAAVPERMCPPAPIADAQPVDVGGSGGTQGRITHDGAPWSEVRWVRDGRTIVLRWRGSSDEALRMARSLREVRR